MQWVFSSVICSDVLVIWFLWNFRRLNMWLELRQFESSKAWRRNLSITCWQTNVLFLIYIHILYMTYKVYIYIYEHLCTLSTDILFDFKAVFWDIYHENLRTASSFLPNNANGCFFLCQETCVYAKIAALICLKN